MTRTRRLSWLLLALAVLAVTPTLADTYFVYNDAGIPPQSDLFTWCDSPPCDVRGFQECATPEGSISLLVNTNMWGGWGIFLQQQADLTAFQNGEVRFFVKSEYDLKVEFQCLQGTPSTIQTYTRFISQQGWDGTTAWQELSVPLADFFSPDPVNLECLAQIKAPFMSTIENLPFFNNFRIDHVRWQTANVHPGASSVEIQGRELTVNGEPFVANGMAYSPISICENWQNAWTDRPDRYLVDFPLIAASGANVVRLYAPITSTAMLDAAWAEGLHVIPTFNPDPVQLTCAEGRAYMQDRLREVVMEWKDHPAILLWLIGNEFNTGKTTDDLCNSWYPQLDSLALTAHTAEGTSFHPVGTANSDTPGLGDICMAGCSDDTTLPNVDFWAVQLYRGCSFTTAFDDYQKPDCARPLIITEFGADSWDSQIGPMENETMQADCLASLLDEADQALAVRTAGGVSSGQVVFEWADEWWKAECDPGTSWCAQDTCTSFTNPAYPDPAMNEEWWGMASLDPADGAARGLRAAYGRVSESWNLGAVCNVDVVAREAGSGDLTLSFDPAAGSMDHTLYYGPLSSVSTYGYSGFVSGLGADGSSSVALPAGSLFWVVAARNNGAEGCYGLDSGGIERPCFPNAAACSVDQAANRTCQCTGP